MWANAEADSSGTNVLLGLLAVLLGGFVIVGLSGVAFGKDYEKP
jgi:hypothetical protein